MLNKKAVIVGQFEKLGDEGYFKEMNQKLNGGGKVREGKNGVK